MKTLLKTTAAALALSAVFVFAAPASAAVSKSELNQTIRSVAGVSLPTINVQERGGVVTISGKFNDNLDRARVINAAKSVDGVKRVVNHAFPST